MISICWYLKVVFLFLFSGNCCCCCCNSKISSRRSSVQLPTELQAFLLHYIWMVSPTSGLSSPSSWAKTLHQRWDSVNTQHVSGWISFTWSCWCIRVRLEPADRILPVCLSSERVHDQIRSIWSALSQPKWSAVMSVNDIWFVDHTFVSLFWLKILRKSHFDF